MMQELNRESTLANAERVHNRVSAEIMNQEIDDQLKRLLDLLVIGGKEYKREKAQRDFLRRAVSNLKLLDGNLIVSYTSAFKIAAETANEDMGWVTGPELTQIQPSHYPLRDY